MEEKIENEDLIVIDGTVDTVMYENKDNGYTVLEFDDFDWSDYMSVKPRFDISKYVGKYVMHVTTEEQDRIFREYLHSVGRKWRSGDSYLERERYDEYKNKTCYNFNNNSYDHKSHYVLNGYTILNFNDFDWSDINMKKFTKKDLKNGDVVKFRDGDVGVVILDEFRIYH